MYALYQVEKQKSRKFTIAIALRKQAGVKGYFRHESQMGHAIKPSTTVAYVHWQYFRQNVYQGVSGNGLILPGEGDTVTLTLNYKQAKYLSLASMLVNTNDAFIGESGINIKTLSVGETFTMNMDVWDSGTEANSETAATIPGPAGGGEGFNAARDDTDAVSFHSGVISQDDGLTASTLSASHRFLNPGARLSITRIE